jgi:hypothetical protein
MRLNPSPLVLPIIRGFPLIYPGFPEYCGLGVEIIWGLVIRVNSRF